MKLLNKFDIDSLHDTIFNALDLEFDNDEQILEYWSKIPTDIKLEAERWGLSDSLVREKIYLWLIKTYKDETL